MKTSTLDAKLDIAKYTAQQQPNYTINYEKSENIGLSKHKHSQHQKFKAIQSHVIHGKT